MASESGEWRVDNLIERRNYIVAAQVFNLPVDSLVRLGYSRNAMSKIQSQQVPSLSTAT